MFSETVYDCLTPEVEIGVPSDTVSVGYADQCLTNGTGLTIEHTFEISGGGALTRPFNETDNDSDGFVECEYVSAAWLGSLSVVGGIDCDDYDDAFIQVQLKFVMVNTMTAPITM